MRAEVWRRPPEKRPANEITGMWRACGPPDHPPGQHRVTRDNDTEPPGIRAGCKSEHAMTIRIVLAEDHALVRAGICALLRQLPDMEVVGEAGDGRAALAMIEALQPDVVLLDIGMPEMNGLDVAAHVARQFPQVRRIMLSMHANEEYVWQALQAGASGYLLKDAGTAELELAIRAVMRGDTYLSPAVSRHVVAGYIRRVGGEREEADALTPRQREILQLIAAGRSTKEIARALSISVKTVETHRAQLMERLGIHDLAGLIRYAIRLGIVSSLE